MTDAGKFIDQFIDDYFSEAEEHLGTVRRLLLTLDEASSAPSVASTNELLRSLHTLKGLSGMVGLTAAEEIAHAMEDGVRALSRDRAAPRELVELFFDGESLLEECVNARRAGVTPPSPGPFVDRLREILRPLDAAAPPDGGQGAPTTESEAVAVATRKFEFAPSAELFERGISVEVVRQKLSTLGEIIATVPRVRPGGGVAFEFIVAPRFGALPDEEWRHNGVSWDPWLGDDASQAVGMVVHSMRQEQPAAVPANAPGTAARGVTTSNVVRVDLTRLDDLMRMVGDLVVARSRLGELVAQAGTAPSTAVLDSLNDANETIERQVRLIREGVMRVRLVAVSEVFERMRFAMRDIAREGNKDIHLEVEGQETEIDKLVVDRMLEPLLHLVRNAASHGIESRDDRIAAGKNPAGTLWLRARAAGDRMVIDVQDDGAGIDAEKIADRARSFGLAVPSGTLDSDAVLDILCAPGFSTRDIADMASGRGVGMSVVRSTIRGLGGELSLTSVAGQGTRFTIELPMTLMITDALILEVGDQAMAIPQSALREIIPLDPGAVTAIERSQVMSHRGKVIPLIDVGVVFRMAPRPHAKRHVLIVGSEAQPTGLVVDAVLGLREIVIHPVTDPMIAVPGIGGATELADGRVSLIIDAGALVRDARPRIATFQTARLTTPNLEALPQRARTHALEETWA